MANVKVVATAAFSLCLVTMAITGLLRGHSVVSTSSGALMLHGCKLPGVEGEARCGTYQVFENRAAKSGRTIQLKLVVLKAISSNPLPDAIFPLHGGPGAAATTMVELAHRGILASVRQNHDLVFVDQRGTGGSNPLNCDVGDNPRDLAAYFANILLPDAVRACREKLQTIADLRLYTTPIAMDDLDDVRAALGYAKIDLLGASYGTIAAQVYLRQHPDHVRSVFLVGVATPNVKQPLLFPRSAQRAMDLLFTDCAADETCRRSFPDLQNEFAAVLSRFDKGPLPMELFDPVAKKPVQITVFRSSFVERIRLAMYSTNTQRFVPFIIHRAYLNDYLPFEAAALTLGPGAGIARGMYFTVTCSEGVPFITDQDVVNETKGTFVGEERVKRHMEACQEWPKGAIAPSYTDFVKSDIPVLMISGEVDGSSPPRFGESALKFLPHGRQLRIRYLGHQIDGPCLSEIFSSFIATGSSEKVDAECTSKIRRPPFATELPPWLALN
ncbi:MAG TPA: alpha/beta hydrolase [Candidatus Angelobacter sp.]|nr:alpha/beta hydrolase [Candidatus Angelobacter sp.]